MELSRLEFYFLILFALFSQADKVPAMLRNVFTVISLASSTCGEGSSDGVDTGAKCWSDMSSYSVPPALSKYLQRLLLRTPASVLTKNSDSNNKSASMDAEFGVGFESFSVDVIIMTQTRLSTAVTYLDSMQNPFALTPHLKAFATTVSTALTLARNNKAAEATNKLRCSSDSFHPNLGSANASAPTADDLDIFAGVTANATALTRFAALYNNTTVSRHQSYKDNTYYYLNNHNDGHGSSSAKDHNDANDKELALSNAYSNNARLGYFLRGLKLDRAQRKFGHTGLQPDTKAVGDTAIKSVSISETDLFTTLSRDSDVALARNTKSEMNQAALSDKSKSTEADSARNESDDDVSNNDYLEDEGYDYHAGDGTPFPGLVTMLALKQHHRAYTYTWTRSSDDANASSESRHLARNLVTFGQYTATPPSVFASFLLGAAASLYLSYINTSNDAASGDTTDTGLNVLATVAAAAVSNNRDSLRYFASALCNSDGSISPSTSSDSGDPDFTVSHLLEQANHVVHSQSRSLTLLPAAESHSYIAQQDGHLVRLLEELKSSKKVPNTNITSSINNNLNKSDNIGTNVTNSASSAFDTESLPLAARLMRNNQAANQHAQVISSSNFSSSLSSASASSSSEDSFATYSRIFSNGTFVAQLQNSIVSCPHATVAPSLFKLSRMLYASGVSTLFDSSVEQLWYLMSLSVSLTRMFSLQLALTAANKAVEKPAIKNSLTNDISSVVDTLVLRSQRLYGWPQALRWDRELTVTTELLAKLPDFTAPDYNERHDNNDESAKNTSERERELARDTFDFTNGPVGSGSRRRDDPFKPIRHGATNPNDSNNTGIRGIGNGNNGSRDISFRAFDALDESERAYHTSSSFAGSAAGVGDHRAINGPGSGSGSRNAPRDGSSRATEINKQRENMFAHIHVQNNVWTPASAATASRDTRRDAAESTVRDSFFGFNNSALSARSNDDNDDQVGRAADSNASVSRLTKFSGPHAMRVQGEFPYADAGRNRAVNEGNQYSFQQHRNQNLRDAYIGSSGSSKPSSIRGAGYKELAHSQLPRLHAAPTKAKRDRNSKDPRGGPGRSLFLTAGDAPTTRGGSYSVDDDDSDNDRDNHVYSYDCDDERDAGGDVKNDQDQPRVSAYGHAYTSNPSSSYYAKSSKDKVRGSSRTDIGHGSVSARVNAREHGSDINSDSDKDRESDNISGTGSESDSDSHSIFSSQQRELRKQERKQKQRQKEQEKQHKQQQQLKPAQGQAGASGSKPHFVPGKKYLDEDYYLADPKLDNKSGSSKSGSTATQHDESSVSSTASTAETPHSLSTSALAAVEASLTATAATVAFANGDLCCHTELGLALIRADAFTALYPPSVSAPAASSATSSGAHVASAVAVAAVEAVPSAPGSIYKKKPASATTVTSSTVALVATAAPVSRLGDISPAILSTLLDLSAPLDKVKHHRLLSLLSCVHSRLHWQQSQSLPLLRCPHLRADSHVHLITLASHGRSMGGASLLRTHIPVNITFVLPSTLTSTCAGVSLQLKKSFSVLPSTPATLTVNVPITATIGSVLSTAPALAKFFFGVDSLECQNISDDDAHSMKMKSDDSSSSKFADTAAVSVLSDNLPDARTVWGVTAKAALAAVTAAAAILGGNNGKDSSASAGAVSRPAAVPLSMFLLHHKALQQKRQQASDSELDKTWLASAAASVPVWCLLPDLTVLFSSQSQTDLAPTCANASQQKSVHIIISLRAKPNVPSGGAVATNVSAAAVRSALLFSSATAQLHRRRAAALRYLDLPDAPYTLSDYTALLPTPKPVSQLPTANVAGAVAASAVATDATGPLSLQTSALPAAAAVTLPRSKFALEGSGAYISGYQSTYGNQILQPSGAAPGSTGSDENGYSWDYGSSKAVNEAINTALDARLVIEKTTSIRYLNSFSPVNLSDSLLSSQDQVYMQQQRDRQSMSGSLTQRLFVEDNMANNNSFVHANGDSLPLSLNDVNEGYNFTDSQKGPDMDFLNTNNNHNNDSTNSTNGGSPAVFPMNTSSQASQTAMNLSSSSFSQSQTRSRAVKIEPSLFSTSSTVVSDALSAKGRMSALDGFETALRSVTITLSLAALDTISSPHDACVTQSLLSLNLNHGVASVSSGVGQGLIRGLQHVALQSHFLANSFTSLDSHIPLSHVYTRMFGFCPLIVSRYATSAMLRGSNHHVMLTVASNPSSLAPTTVTSDYNNGQSNSTSFEAQLLASCCHHIVPNNTNAGAQGLDTFNDDLSVAEMKLEPVLALTLSEAASALTLAASHYVTDVISNSLSARTNNELTDSLCTLLQEQHMSARGSNTANTIIASEVYADTPASTSKSSRRRIRSMLGDSDRALLNSF